MLGEHVWDEEMLKETRGLFMMLAVSYFSMRLFRYLPLILGPVRVAFRTVRHLIRCCN